MQNKFSKKIKWNWWFQLHITVQISHLIRFCLHLHPFIYQQLSRSVPQSYILLREGDREMSPMSILTSPGAPSDINDTAHNLISDTTVYKTLWRQRQSKLGHQRRKQLWRNHGSRRKMRWRVKGHHFVIFFILRSRSTALAQFSKIKSAARNGEIAFHEKLTGHRIRSFAPAKSGSV